LIRIEVSHAFWVLGQRDWSGSSGVDR